jgi:hypothetical protein
MASEDSVENLSLRDATVLAVAIDGVGQPNEFNDAFESPVPTLVHKVDGGREDLVVDYTRRKAHVVPEDKHVLVPTFGKDRAGPELLRSHLQEAPSIPVLIEKELRLDEVAERSRRMPLERHAHAALSFNEAG